MGIIHLINDTSLSNHPLGNILLDCWSLVEVFEAVSINTSIGKQIIAPIRWQMVRPFWPGTFMFIIVFLVVLLMISLRI